jgi:hypothetical protein
MCTDEYREALTRAHASTVSPALAQDAAAGDQPEALAADENPDQPRRLQPASAWNPSIVLHL